MRFIHLADLHLGRSLAEFSLIDLQREALTEIVNYAAHAGADAVVIAGDVYDRSTPSVQAVNLLSGFLSALSRLNIPALIIAGNHDSTDRLAFLSDILGQAGIHIAGDYRLGQPPVTLSDAFGPVNFYLLPFFRPGHIRAQAVDEPVAGYDDAVRVAIERMPIDASQRNVLVGHQFVCAAGHVPIRSDSEMLFAGGTELVSAAHFAPFDYVALGHLHQAQRVGAETVRYAGAPLKYALGEAGAAKSFTVVDMMEKGAVSVKQEPFHPSVGLRAVRGRLEDILAAPPAENDGDFLEVLLTDEEPVYDAMQRLRARYPRTVNVRRERDMMLNMPGGEPVARREDRRDPMAVFSRFASEITGLDLTVEEQSDMRDVLTEAAREEDA
ncbi:MAG: exonuclease SbcCD subunit D [Clostridia bacterium]|nr:exonuclease SbcCD subunit D [Clostridia bacterium]